MSRPTPQHRGMGFPRGTRGGIHGGRFMLPQKPAAELKSGIAAHTEETECLLECGARFAVEGRALRARLGGGWGWALLDEGAESIEGFGRHDALQR